MHNISEATLAIVQLIIVLGLFAGLGASLFHHLDVTFDGEFDDDDAYDDTHDPISVHPEFFGRHGRFDDVNPMDLNLPRDRKVREIG